MFLLQLFTERPFSDPHFSCLLLLGLLPPAGPPAPCPSLPRSFSLVCLLANPLVLLFYLYFIICEYIFLCPQLSLVFLFSSPPSCITCFPAHCTRTWMPFCFGQRSALDHPIFVSLVFCVSTYSSAMMMGPAVSSEISVHVCKTAWHPCRDNHLQKLFVHCMH